MDAQGRPKKPHYWLLLVLFLLWIAFAMASYYLVQNAFLQRTIETIKDIDRWLGIGISPPAVLQVLLGVAVALWIAFVALGVGRWILARLKLVSQEAVEELLFGFGMGFGAMGLSLLFLGLLGLISRPILLVLLTILTIMVGRSNLTFIRGLSVPRLHIILTLFLALSFFLALTLALLPPASWDALFYHLTGPKLYLDHGQIISGIDIPHLNFPSLFEMLFMLALGIDGEGSAVLIHFTFAILLMGLVSLSARELLGVRQAWTAVLFLLAMPMVLALASWAYNDLALAFYEVAALYALLKWHRAKQAALEALPLTDNSESGYAAALPIVESGWLLLSGSFLGLAMGLKYTSVVALISLAGLMFWWYRKDIRNLVKPMVLLLGIAFLLAVPWFAKNLLFTGNPVYPFIFGGEYWDSFRAAAYGEGGTGIAYNPETCNNDSPEYLTGQHPTGCEFDLLYLARNLVLLPYDITLGLQDASQDGPVGPMFLIFLPIILVYGLFVRKEKRPGSLNALLFFSGVQFAFWIIGVVSSASLWQTRLLLPALVALCPVLSWLLEQLVQIDHPRFSLQRQLYLVIGLVLLIGLGIQLVKWLPHQPWAYLTGAETREENLNRRLGAHYEAMEQINTSTPEDAVVAFFWEPRSYYCQRECRPDSILDSFGHLQYLYGDAGSIASSMHSEGISHVLIFESGLDFVLEANSPLDEPLPEPDVLQELREKFMEPLTSDTDSAYTLYRLTPGHR